MKDTKIAIVATTEVPDLDSTEKVSSTYNASQFVPSERWPTEPAPLRSGFLGGAFATLWDLALILTSMGLLVKTGLVIKAWHKDRDHHGFYVDQASLMSQILVVFNDQMVTAFTVVFGLIISTLVRRYALWKAQKGAYVRELEQLQGSTSLPSTFKMVWSLKVGNITSVVLILIWSFYYLGSQASSREYKIVQSGPRKHQLVGVQSLYHYNFFEYNTLDGKDTASSSTIYDAITAAYAYTDASDSTASKAIIKPGVDMYGMALIPNIIVLEGLVNEDHLRSDIDTPLVISTKHNWLVLGSLGLLQSANSYLWIARTGYNFWTYDPTRPDLEGSDSDTSDNSFDDSLHATIETMLGSYQFRSRQIVIGCAYPSKQPYSAFPKGTLESAKVSFNMTPISSTAPLNTNMTSNSIAAPQDMYGNQLRTFEYWVRWADQSEQESLLGSQIHNGSAVTVCNVTTVAVDVKAVCGEEGCFPSAIRYVNGSTKQQATNYSTPFDNDKFATNFFNAFSLYPKVSGLLGGVASPMWRWGAYDEDSPDVTDDKRIAEAQLITSGVNDLVNNFYATVQNTLAGLPNMTAIIHGDASDDSWVPALFYGAAYDPHYAISWPWIAIDFVACTILFVAAVVCAMLRLMTVAPDIFGYVSTLTRDNARLEGVLPDTGTGLNGIERAKMLRGVKVRIGDVSGDDSNVARVGLAVVKCKADGGAGLGSSESVERVKAAYLRPNMHAV